MASLNRIVIMGRLQADPESRFSVEGVPIAKFPISVNSGFNQAPGRIDVVCFRNLAEICGQYLKKDINVLVEGRLQVRSYDDQGGTRKWVTEVSATNIELVDKLTSGAPAQKEQTQAAQELAGAEEEEVEELPEDDLPF